VHFTADSRNVTNPAFTTRFCLSDTNQNTFTKSDKLFTKWRGTYTYVCDG